MDESRLRARVDAPVTHVETTPSTNDRARRLGHEGAPHGAVVVADEQTASRGRNGDAWVAPSGGVWLSVVLRHDVSPAHVGRLTFAGGVAVAETAAAFDVEAGITWPNDLVYRDGTLAGVLTEAVVDDVPVADNPVDEVLPGTDPADADLSFVVLGVGLNADLDPDDLDTDRDVATMREAVCPVDPTAVAVEFHDRLHARARAVETDSGVASVRSGWRERSRTLGERVEPRTDESIECVRWT